jgi:hypothetical protein
MNQNNHIQFSLFNLEVDKELRCEIEYLINGVIDSAKSDKFWSDRLISIIITDNIELEVQKKPLNWTNNEAVSKSRDYGVISKLLFNSDLENPQYQCILTVQSLILKNPSLKEIIYNQLFQIKADKKLPRELREIFYTKLKPSLENYIKIAAIQWVKAYYVRSLVLDVFASIPHFKHEAFLTAFKRELKRNLYAYNSEEYYQKGALSRFWEKYIVSIQEMILRIIENYSTEEEFLIQAETPEKLLIYDIIEEIENLTKSVLEHKVLQIEGLKKKILDFSKCYDIILSKETEDGFHINFSKDPKEYFKNEIIDTEPRIVCFMDILGFSNFIEDYDTNLKSSVLQDIQESFSQAKEGLLENPYLNKEIVKHLEYQTFSDNICISIPFFDNPQDFLSNFNILITYVRGFQYLMMNKGFFTRGGISTGSYYADKNIIFSMGLVKAYMLESKQAIYPRVIVDKAIIERFRNYSEDELIQYGLSHAIIMDWEKTAFLNPTGLLKSSIGYLKGVMANAFDTEEDEEPLLHSINNFSKNMSELTVKMLEQLVPNEEESYNTIKEHIERNIVINQNNKPVLSKYLWIKEFFEWLEGSDDAKLSFDYLTDRLEKEK